MKYVPVMRIYFLVSIALQGTQILFFNIYKKNEMILIKYRLTRDIIEIIIL